MQGRRQVLTELSASHIRAAVQSFYYDEIDSTNNEARRLLEQGRIADAAWVLARGQTSGRGTRGRVWVSPVGAGLCLSVVHSARNVRWPVTTTFTKSAAVACVEVLREVTGATVRIRPINDLMIDGRKLGGILTETVVAADRVEAVITGIGINVRTAPTLTGDDRRATTCLAALATGPVYDDRAVRDLAERIARRVDARHRQVFTGDIAEIERLECDFRE
ncbi:MAG: biotin--[acetyl-CoA-carboxylase] ligase [Phycisphaerae bacterium]|nr:MAG: biotin--[acetyl-CoA-carboxylase] ligase [Planctomycetota bacterium]KAB2941341.1 MAG: biotin--[acetyl-CoA-carboxylase] ligase [Phycisphaerae bacterium]MBE7455809.1 biotin--[acetyl-CoA-carboxylase] ligase [Planctomycetia bacterium]MCK6463444.1 biotin--[acetyl-CoA-carboxylase] ligase [Phycisphaerae bacterium]MCL4717067.1 biotin--[acetyl-CoA-carboxylase] ligase [Phycisphaerae bacterium]